MQWDIRRPTSVVVLAVRARDDFPRIFRAPDGPDFALDPSEVDVNRVCQARALLLTGSMLANEKLRDFSIFIAEKMVEAGSRVVMDLDFRPVLWGLAPIDRGQAMLPTSPDVASAYAPLLPSLSLIVGTRQEICAAGGSDELKDAIDEIRRATEAPIVIKAGHAGSSLVPASADLEAQVSAASFEIDVVNSVGAGDAFMSGFLSRWLHSEPLDECLRAGNASGAIVASRHGCMPAMPVTSELRSFMVRGGVRKPDLDEEIERIHRVATRPPNPHALFVLAIDHRWQLEELAHRYGATRDRLFDLKNLLGKGFLRVARERDDCGLIADDQYGRQLLEELAGDRYWTARAIEIARSRPVRLLGGGEVQAYLHSWAADHVVKVMCYADPNDPMDLALDQVGVLRRLTEACRNAGHELLIELQSPEVEGYERDQLAELISRLYNSGVHPEWWKLPRQRDLRSWERIGEVIAATDPTCRGVLVLGGPRADLTALASSFSNLAEVPFIRGFAVGRAIFSDSAAAWMRKDISDDVLVSSVAGYFGGGNFRLDSC